MQKEPDNRAHWIAAGIVTIFAISELIWEPWQTMLRLLFLFSLGGFCIVQYVRYKTLHCLIAGPGTVFIGVLAVLRAATWGRIWFLFIAVWLIGWLVEHHHGKKR